MWTGELVLFLKIHPLPIAEVCAYFTVRKLMGSDYTKSTDQTKQLYISVSLLLIVGPGLSIQEH